jgi:DUF4097 and DUF4098 domain-containing protein YvlB
MKFREILLVVVLVLAGFVVFQVKTGKWSLNDGDWVWLDDFGFAGQQATAEEQRTIAAPLPPAIEIANSHGSVEVRGGDQDFVQVTFKKSVWRRKKEDAESVAAQVRYTLTSTADKLTLASNRAELAQHQNIETSFILTVPRSMVATITNSYGTVLVESVQQATVRNSHGELTAANVSGSCVLETSYDDIEADGIKGPCRIINSHGDVRAGSITGDLSVETSYARIRVNGAGGKADLRGPHTDVEALRISGPVTVDTSYEKVVLGDVGPAKVTGNNMDVTAETVHGDLEVETSYEPVRAEGVQGRLIVDAHNATVTAKRIDGPSISIKTSYESVWVTDFSGGATVVDHNGKVTLEPRDLKGAIDVHNEYGAIDFVWPAGGKARLEARSKGGNVSWGLADKLDVNETDGVSLVKAFSSELTAPLIVLSTTYDNIHIQEGARKF